MHISHNSQKNCTTFVFVFLWVLQSSEEKLKTMTVFIRLEDALSVWTNFGQTFVVRLVMCLKYKDRHERHYASRPGGRDEVWELPPGPDELPFVVRRSRRISKESSSRRIMRLVPVFILETHNQTNYKYLRKFVQTDNASSV